MPVRSLLALPVAALAALAVAAPAAPAATAASASASADCRARVAAPRQTFSHGDRRRSRPVRSRRTSKSRCARAAAFPGAPVPVL